MEGQRIQYIYIDHENRSVVVIGRGVVAIECPKCRRNRESRKPDGAKELTDTTTKRHMTNKIASYDHIPDIWDAVEQVEQIAGKVWGDLYLVELFKWTDGDYYIMAYHVEQNRKETLVCGGDEGWLWYVIDTDEDPSPDQGSLIRGNVKYAEEISNDPNSIDQDVAIDLYQNMIVPFSI